MMFDPNAVTCCLDGKSGGPLIISRGWRCVAPLVLLNVGLG